MRKAFSIEAAKSGLKVVTRDGRSARIVAYDLDSRFPICAILRAQNGEEYPEVYLKSGCYDEYGMENNNDLFIEEEPIYRPYANAEEMDAAIKEHGTFVKNLLGRRLTITGYDDEAATVGVGGPARYGTLLKCYTWLDGTPCGVQEGGDND